MEKYITHLQTDRLTIESDEEFLVNLDGEGLVTNRAELELLPGGLRFFHPRNMAFFAGKTPESAFSTV